MKITRRHVTLGIVSAAIVLAGTVAWLRWRDARQFGDTRAILSRFPAEDAIVLNIDFSKIRSAGFLSDSRIPLEPEYKQFLDGTNFNYRSDLDSVVASFSKSGNFFIARGRFDWKKLRDYAAHQGGSCYQDVCRMVGSTPQRHISFLPLRDDVMALAVSTDDMAATRLTQAGNPITAQLPSAPVWVSVPGAALHESAAFPPGLGLMLSALGSADRLVITVNQSGAGLAAKLEANCRSQDDARVLASQLRTVTAKLKEASLSSKEAQSDELVQVLAGGKFDDSGTRVNGQWPFSKALLASLTSGI